MNQIMGAQQGEPYLKSLGSKSTAPHLGMPPIRAPIYTKISDFDVFLIK